MTVSFVAACTDKGARNRVNQDACCIKVAQTSYGEMVMAVVCDGVGGLAMGELASASVVYRFVRWFDEELKTLLLSMGDSASVDWGMVQTVWGVMLSSLNELIMAYGRAHGGRLGTTFSGLIACGGTYLVGHVGDTRVYHLSPRAVRQITKDQTLLAKKLADGELTPEEARRFPQKHVILQSVGTEGMLRPEFYTGTFSSSDLFVLCCDGAYRKAEAEGIESFFANVDWSDERALERACASMLSYDLKHGEKDNLTVMCVSGNLDSAHGEATPHSQTVPRAVEDDDVPTTVESHDDEDDVPTTVESHDDEDDVPTTVEAHDDGVPTVVEGGA